MNKISKYKYFIQPVLLVLLAGGFYFYRLGSLPLIDYDEATYAQVMRQSFNAGSFGSFIRGGLPWQEKPLLYFWLAAGSTKIFGFNEFALRLPAALCGIATIVLLWWFVKKVTGNPWAGFAAGLILICSGEFIYAGSQIRMDVPLAFSVFSAAVFFYLGWQNKKYFWLMGVSLASAMLFKNFMGLLAGPVFLVFALVFRQWKFLKDKWFWAAISLAALLAAPWHIYESLKYGKIFWHNFLGYHLLQRYTQPILGGQITVFHYFKYLFYLVEPWVPAAVLAMGILIVMAKKQKNNFKFKLAAAALFSASAIFLVFALARTKLFYYLEPIYPFLALGLAMTGLLCYEALTKRMWRDIFIILIGLLFIGGAINITWQKVFLRRGFSDDYGIAGDEKASALKILAQNDNRPAYILGWTWTETFSYYYDRPFYNPLSEPLRTPCYLVVPSGLLDVYRLSDPKLSASKIYKGENLETYSVIANN